MNRNANGNGSDGNRPDGNSPDMSGPHVDGPHVDGLGGDESARQCDECLATYAASGRLLERATQGGVAPTGTGDGDESAFDEEASQYGASEQEALEHLTNCPSCRAEAHALERQGALLAAHFASLSVPPMPPLAARPALHAASGYPRRVSLNVLPFVLLLWLIGLLAVGALAWFVVRHFGTS